MKVRNSFVSNSSSSSFIIEVSKECHTVFDLAKKMIPVREWESDDDDIDRVDQLIAKGIDPNHPLAFQSCNFETFIVPIEYDDRKYFVISTCNNHDWWEVLDDFDHPGHYRQREILQEIAKRISSTYPHKDEIGKSGDPKHDLEWAVPHSADFIWLHTDVPPGRWPDHYHTWCTCKTWGPQWQISADKVVCAGCQKELKPRDD